MSFAAIPVLCFMLTHPIPISFSLFQSPFVSEVVSSLTKREFNTGGRGADVIFIFGFHASQAWGHLALGT